MGDKFDLTYKNIDEISTGTPVGGSDYTVFYDVSAGDWKKAYASSDLTGVTATADEINRIADVSVRGVTVTATSLTITEALHEGRTVVLNTTASQAFTLPAATGSFGRYRFVCGQTVAGTASSIKVVDSTDTMVGTAIFAADGGNTAVAFEAGATADSILLDSTSGGIDGTIVELEDCAANKWTVRIIGQATGTEATPFSATV